jgi:hypothetical protein
MSYRIHYFDRTGRDGYATGLVNEHEGARIVNGQGRPFVQLEGRQDEVYIAVSQVFKVEKAGVGENKPASTYRP